MVGKEGAGEAFLGACRRGELARVQQILTCLQVSCNTFTRANHSSRFKDLEVQDKGDGNTGLMLAAREGHLPIVTALLLHGAKFNAANK